MSAELIERLIQQIDALEAVMKKIQAELHEHRLDSTSAHQILSNRTALLEREMRVGKWVSGGFGAGFGIVLTVIAREYVPVLLQHIVTGGG